MYQNFWNFFFAKGGSFSRKKFETLTGTHGLNLNHNYNTIDDVFLELFCIDSISKLESTNIRHNLMLTQHQRKRAGPKSQMTHSASIWSSLGPVYKEVELIFMFNRFRIFYISSDVIMHRKGKLQPLTLLSPKIST